MNKTTSIIHSVSEAITCFLKGIRAALSLRAVLTIALLWLSTAFALLVLFYTFREPIQRAAMMVSAVFVATLSFLFSSGGTSTPGVVGGGLGAVTAIFSAIATGWILIAAAYYLSLLIIVRALSEILLMKLIQKQALQSYAARKNYSPTQHTTNKWSRLHEFSSTWGLLLISPLAALVPILGLAIFFTLLAFLNARFFVNEAIAGLEDQSTSGNIAKARRIEILTIGLFSSFISIVPFVGILAPWATGSAVCHLAFRHIGIPQRI